LLLRVTALIIQSLWLVSAQETPVIEAVHQGHAVGHEEDGVRAIEAALAAGGNVNERDRAGWTPLMHAALECRAAEVNLLLVKGADPKLRGHAKDNGEFTESGLDPLLLASGCFIARRRADLAPERHMPEGYVAYELAAAGKMARELVIHGADVNTADIHGRSPLMMAAMQGWPDVLRTLLDAHANPDARDHSGHSVLDFADPRDAEIIAILTTAGTAPSSGHSARVVCDAQRALGSPIIDCIAGTQFAEGLRKYQQKHGLRASGALDSPTLRALGVQQ
jgi:hypothetical protein